MPSPNVRKTITVLLALLIALFYIAVGRLNRISDRHASHNTFRKNVVHAADVLLHHEAATVPSSPVVVYPFSSDASPLTLEGPPVDAATISSVQLVSQPLVTSQNIRTTPALGGEESAGDRTKLVAEGGGGGAVGGPLVSRFPPPAGDPSKADARQPLYPIHDDTDEPTRMVEAIDPQTPAADAVPYDRPEDADKLAKKGSIWFTLVRKYKNAPIEVLANPSEPAMCLISAVYTRNCKYLDESFRECVKRIGVAAIELVLSQRCVDGDYWKSLSKRLLSKQPASNALGRPTDDTSVLTTSLLRGTVAEADTCRGNQSAAWLHHNHQPHAVGKGNPFRFIVAAPMGPPRVCKGGALQYPVAFGIPSVAVVPAVMPKLFDFSPIVVGGVWEKAPSTMPAYARLNENDEDTYQAILGLSRFCLTHARGGWDCGRHYEIMGAGCVPYFYDIHAAGPYILPQFPKKLLRDIVKMPMFSHIGYIEGADGDVMRWHKVNKDKAFVRRFGGMERVIFKNEPFTLNQSEAFNTTWYWSTARKLLRYTRQYLTTEAMAAYVLKTMGLDAETARRIMVFMRPGWDNLQQSMLTGLDGLGIALTIVGATPHHRAFYLCSGGEDATNGTHSTAAGSSPPLSARALSAIRTRLGRSHDTHGNGFPWAQRMRHRNDTLFNDSKEEALRLLSHGGYDAVLYLYQDDGLHWDECARVNSYVKGKVAVMDGRDSSADPTPNSVRIAKEHAYFFSRELRMLAC